MGRGKNTFRQSDVRRGVKAARQAGLEVSDIEIEPSGKIRIITGSREPGEPNGADANNPWDKVLTNAADKERAS